MRYNIPGMDWVWVGLLAFLSLSFGLVFWLPKDHTQAIDPVEWLGTMAYVPGGGEVDWSMPGHLDPGVVEIVDPNMPYNLLFGLSPFYYEADTLVGVVSRVTVEWLGRMVYAPGGGEVDRVISGTDSIFYSSKVPKLPMVSSNIEIGLLSNGTVVWRKTE